MATATYNLYFDLTGDGDFVDSNEDVSTYLKKAKIQIGMAQAFDRMGRSNTMEATLSNVLKKFSPEHANVLTGFGQGTVAKLTMTYDGTTKTRYIGRISPEGISPEPGLYRGRETEIRCDGLFRELMRENVSISTQENISTNALALMVLERSRIVPIGYTGMRVDVVGASEVNTAVVQDVANYCNFDTGVHTFDIVADNWPAEISVFNALKRITEAEWGRCFEDRDGTIRFWNRHRTYKDYANAVDWTLNNAREMDYKWGGNVIKRTEVTFHARKIDDSTQIVAQLDNKPEFLGRGAAIKKGKGWSAFQLKLRSPAGTNIGVRSLIKPVPHIDYRAFSSYRLEQGRADAEITDQVSILADIVPGGVRWTVVSNFLGLGKIFPARGNPSGAVQRGTRIIDYGTDIRRTFNTSAKEGDPIKVDLAGGTSEEAQYLADGILFERSAITGAVKKLGFWANSSHSFMVMTRDAEIGDSLTTTEAQTGHSRRYIIVGRIDNYDKGHKHYVEFILEPAPPPVLLVGITGYSEVNTAVVGF